MASSPIAFLLQWGASVVACLMFLLVGRVLVSRRDSVFYSLFHGINFSVAVYAVVVARFETIHSLVVVAYVVWWGRRRAWSLLGVRLRECLGVAVACLFFVLVFHLLPESEYKQNDSFFYLKMAEALNATGQENMHAFNNLPDPAFHGVEAYHYFELWLNALLIRGTRFFLPDIQAFRFVGYTVISVCVLYGLWVFFEAFGNRTGAQGRRAGWWERVLGVAFLFFLPDLIGFFPFLQHYLVYNFESNMLERPNFRTIYMFLIPFWLDRKAARDDAESGVYFVSLAVVSYVCFLVVVPAMLLYSIFRRRLWLFGLAFFTGAYFLLFYGVFGNKVIGGFYHNSVSELWTFLRQHSFFVGSTIVSTLVYIGFIILLYTWFFGGRQRVASFWRKHKKLIVEGGIMVVISVVMARVLSFQDNAYQLAYFSYILAALFIFGVWAVFGAGRAGVLACGVVLFSIGYGLTRARSAPVDVFRQNGAYVYGGRPYSGEYLRQVSGYFSTRERVLGGYLGDSNYYKGLYYSRRNPNVYFPPISYIIADRVESNYEFCLSDSAALFVDLDLDRPIEGAYLAAAVRRSGFYVYSRGRQRGAALLRFVQERGLEYVIVSGKGGEAELAGLPVVQRFEDGSTGEVFLALRPGGR